MINIRKLICRKASLVRRYSVQWGYECELQFHNNNMDVNYKHRVKYIDTAMGDRCKRSVLILPDNPGDSDDYIALCHSLHRHNYRVVVANYPRTDKVRNLSFSATDGFRGDTVVSYLSTFLTNVSVERLDFIVAHGWGGYDALNLESMIPTDSHLLLVNFPKIFDPNEAYVGPIPAEFTNTMHDMWRSRLMRWMFKRYIDYKLSTFRRAPGFENLSRDEIETSLLYYGGVDFTRARQNAVFNNSRSLGLVNLPHYEPGYNAADRDKYRTYFGLLQQDVFSMDLDDKWQHINARKRYEVNLDSQTPQFIINSTSFGQFLAAWFDWLVDRDHKLKRITQ